MKKLLLILSLHLLIPSLSAQQVGIKTNLLGWGTTTPNVSIEVALGLKTTLDIQGRYNPFRFGSSEDNKKLQHWVVMPEVRMWLFEKYEGHFFGLHILYGRYNAGGVKLPLGIFPDLEEHRFEGYGAGLGVSWGYQWVLGPHWNLEATFGFGYSYLNYDKYQCHRCGDFIGKEIKQYFGPTKVGLSLVYFIKSKKY